MRISLALFLLIITMPALAQLNPKRKQDLIFLSYTAQQYFNKGNIEREGTGQHLSAKNTPGWNLGLAYQHITRFGLTINYGLQLGEQSQHLYTFHDLTDFDPDASMLQGFTYVHESNFKAHYFNQRFMLGYVKALPFAKGWALEVKAGTGVKAYSIGTDSTVILAVIYQTDDGNIKGRTVFSYDPRLGNTNDGKKIRLLQPGQNSFDHTWEIYLGLRKDVGLKYLRTVNFGVEFTRARSMRNADFVTVRTYDGFSNKTTDETYRNRNLSIGLHLALGLWP